MQKVAFFIVAVVLLSGCSSIDCPLNSRVSATYRFAGATNNIASVSVATTIDAAEGNDSVLINLQTNIDSVALPMSYARAEDTFYFSFATTDDTTICDTVVVAKQDQPHFESVDCNPAIFHTITDVRYTKNVIEKIDINNNTVTYNADKAHFIIHLKGDND